MAETHEPITPRERRANPGLGFVHRADLVELIDDLRRRAAVPRSLERPDRARDRRGNVGVRRDDHPGREGRGIEPVLGADNEVRVQRPRRRRVGPLAAQLVQEARSEPQVRIGRNRLLAVTQAGEGRQHGGRRCRDGARLVDRGWPRHAGACTPGRDRGAQGIHRAGSRWQAAQHVHHLRRQRSAREARARVPVPRPQELGDRGIGPSLDQLADRIAAVVEPARLAIDRREGRLSGDDPLQPGREGVVRGIHLRIESSGGLA